MHEIKIDKWWFSNLLSYGNNINEVVIKEGMIWIKGPNGAGKSAILEALNFIFFGTPYRDINNLMLKNTSNKSPLKAGGQIRRISSKGEDVYIIEREMSNSGTIKTKINKNGSDESKNSITQKLFETEVLGFNQTIFENIISLNTIQTTPFIEMETKEKRKLVESVLTLNIDKYKKTNSNALKEAQTGFVAAESDQRKYQQDVIDLDKIIEQLKNEKENDIKELETQISTYEEKIKTKEEEKTIILKEIDSITESGKSDKDLYEKTYKLIESKISDYKSLKKHLLDIDRIETNLQAKNAEFNTIDIEYKQLSAEMNAFDKDDSKKLLNIINEIKVLNTKSITLGVNIENNKKTMEGITKQVESYVVGTPCPMCTKPSTHDDIEVIKNESRTKYKTLKKDNSDKENEKKSIDNQISEKEIEKNTIQSQVDLKNITNVKFTESEKKVYSLKGDVTSLENDKKRSISEKDQLLTKLNETSVKSEDIDSIVSGLEVENIKGNELKEKLNKLRDELVQKQEIVKSHDKMISEYNNQLTDINNKIIEKKKKDIDTAFSSTEKKLLGAKSDLETAKKRITKYSDEISICKYIEGMYNDDGIKKLVLGIFVPNLNKAIAHNLNMFELPFMIEFDDSMECRFSNSHGTAPSYNNLSQGQKRKLNFAISIAFRDFVTAIADFKINVLFLDEVLDISTDYEALDHMLTLLKNKIYEIGSIYLMTHRGDDFVHHFDGMVKVKYDGRYSEIEV